MKSIKLIFLSISISLFLGCQDTTPLEEVVKNRIMVQKGMNKTDVQKILKVTPDEVSQIGNYELWIYKGIITKDDKSTFNDYIIKFKDGKVVYTGYFNCKLPKIEE